MKNISGILIGLLAVLFFASCSTTRVVYVKKAPPAKIVEIRPKKIHNTAVWIDGYWKWNRRINDFVWIKGQWEINKRNHTRVNGNWKKNRHGWFWVKGYWK